MGHAFIMSKVKLFNYDENAVNYKAIAFFLYFKCCPIGTARFVFENNVKEAIYIYF